MGPLNRKLHGSVLLASFSFGTWGLASTGWSRKSLNLQSTHIIKNHFKKTHLQHFFSTLYVFFWFPYRFSSSLSQFSRQQWWVNKPGSWSLRHCSRWPAQQTSDRVRPQARMDPQRTIQAAQPARPPMEVLRVYFPFLLPWHRDDKVRWITSFCLC